MTIKNTIIGTVFAVGFTFTGCSQTETALSNTLINSAASTTGVGSTFNPASSLASPASVGMAQSQVIGAQMLANPAVLGVGAVSGAISEQNQQQNKAAYSKLSALTDDSGSTNNAMEMMMVQQFNKQKGTHFKSMQELQDYAKITGYNEQEKTNFTTFTQVREDYNKKKGTNFKTDKEFRDWLEEN